MRPGAQVDMLIIERRTGQAKHQPRLVGGAGRKDAVQGVTSHDVSSGFLPGSYHHGPELGEPSEPLKQRRRHIPLRKARENYDDRLARHLRPLA